MSEVGIEQQARSDIPVFEEVQSIAIERCGSGLDKGGSSYTML